MREQVENAARAAGKILDYGIQLCDERTILYRRKICDECEYQGKVKCMACGCVLILKRPLATEECPLGKWSMTYGPAIEAKRERESRESGIATDVRGGAGDKKGIGKRKKRAGNTEAAIR